MKTAEPFNANCNYTCLLFRIHYSHSPPYVSVAFGGTLGKSNLTLVGISLHSIHFLSQSQKKQKCIYFLYGTWFMELRRLRMFAFLFGPLHLFPTGHKICFHEFFLCLHPPAKL